MRIRSPITLIAVFALLTVAIAQDRVQAQGGCTRCAAPIGNQNRSGVFVPMTDSVIRFKPVQFKLDDGQPTPIDNDGSVVGDNRSISSKGQSTSTPVLVPTDSVVPSTTEVSPTKLRPASAPGPKKPSIADKINARYADPRIVRMLQQLTPQAAESFYIEVSELIDERHIGPATYARRVDSAIDHFAQALEVPSFAQAAQLRATKSGISDLREDLQQLRTQVRVRNTNDALLVMRSVQRMATQSVSINPAAINLEFLYGATDSLDQFSMLLPPEKNGGPSVGIKDNVVGIGVEVEPHPNGLKIVKLLPGGPAALADLHRGDIITRADGNELRQLELNRAVDFIAGPLGTQVQIEASREGRSGMVTLTRQRIALHSVVDVRMEDRSRRIGYLKLEQFSDSTVGEIDSALMSLHQQGMESLIMDLRGNPGGLLTTAIALSDRFLASGTIVSTRGRTPEDNTREVAHLANTWRTPLVVLIDHNSASASEIFAAAIQENHRGVIVGERSYGKGTVQTLFPLQTVPAALRLTTAKFYSPEGREMAGAGVTPDFNVPSENDASGAKDAALIEAIRQINDPRVKEMGKSYRRTGEAVDESHVAA